MLEHKRLNEFKIYCLDSFVVILSISMKNVVDFAVLVMKQDAEACELNQKGIHNPIRKSGSLMPEEYEIKRFHNWLRKKL